MGGVGQFPELVLPGGALVEIHQRGIDADEIELRVGTPVAAHAGVRRGRGAQGQQMQVPATQVFDDVGDAGGEIPQLAGGGNDGESPLIKLAKLFFQRGLTGGGSAASFAKHSRKGAIDCVARAEMIGLHRDAHILAFRPVLTPIRSQAVGLGPEIAHLAEGEIQLPTFSRRRHGDVPPGGARKGRGLCGLGTGEADHLLADLVGPGKVGTEQPPPPRCPWAGMAELDPDPVSGVVDDASSGQGGHGGGGHDVLSRAGCFFGGFGAEGECRGFRRRVLGRVW